MVQHQWSLTEQWDAELWKTSLCAETQSCWYDGDNEGQFSCLFFSGLLHWYTIFFNHVMLLFSSPAASVWNLGDGTISIEAKFYLPSRLSWVACACLPVLVRLKQSLQLQSFLLLKPGLKIGQLMLPLPCACLSFLLVILSSQEFENLALGDINCGEMPTVVRDKGV